MQIDELRQKIESTIASSDAKYRTLLARQIIEAEIPIKEIIDILLEEPPISTRFSWLLGDILMQSPDSAQDMLIECYSRLDRIKIKNFDRSLSKQIMLCASNLPVELEGELVSLLFDWLMDAKITVSTKNHCLYALEKLCKKYPDLKGEFVEVVQQQKDLNTKEFKKRAEKVLLRMG